MLLSPVEKYKTSFRTLADFQERLFLSTFAQFKLPPTLDRALKKMEFQTPTPIQIQAIPFAMKGKDLIATAQTGTGKTAAFSLPIATHLLENPNITALVLAPTRELALQIEMFWKELTQFTPDLKCACVIGGTSMNMQIKALSRAPRLIIATPGRLVDHLQRRTVNLGRLGILVLDEADRMLDMGFAPQLNQIMRVLPRDRQTLLFSATWPSTLDQLSKKYLSHPERVAVGTTSRAANTVKQSAIQTTAQKKNETLMNELNTRQGSVLIFVRTQSRTDRLARFLDTAGIEVGRIHGGRSQGQRTSALANFKNGKIRVLCATDIAARGIDVTEIAHVINYDLPQVPEDYIHRIGRTGRAGTSGEALSILTPEDRQQWSDISKLLKKSGSATPQMTG